MSEKLAWFKPTLIGLLIIGVLAAATVFTLSIRSCLNQADERFRAEIETRIYEHGASLSRDSRIILASKKSGFVIPRDLVKKLILGLKTTAKIEIACEATIYYYIDASDLQGARYSWKGKALTITLAPPRPMRPVIETSTIRQAVLKRGFLFNERAELETLLSQLSDLVAASAGTAAEDAVLETSAAALSEMALAAAKQMKRRPETVSVEWAR
jgi:hypothetical protein